MLVAPVVCMDWQRHSCIVVRVTPKKIFYVPMDSAGLELKERGVDSFLEIFRPTNYPTRQAASHYLGCTKHVPISAGARRQLEQLKAPGDASMLEPEQLHKILGKVSILDLNGDVVSAVTSPAEPISAQPLQEQDTMAAPKKQAAGTKVAAKKPEAKAKPSTKKAVAAEPKARKPGVGALIMDALIAGKDTEEILMDVREQFPDSTAVGSTVSWYRGKLRKEGKLKD